MNKAEQIKIKRLITTAQSLQKKRPWELFDEIGILAITLANRKTPFYCVFLQETIIVCPNPAALKGLLYMSEQEHMPDIQRLRYQQHFACFFDQIEDLSEQWQSILKQLDIQPIDDKYPNFESAMPGILPDTLVKQEIQTMLDILIQIGQSIDQIADIKALDHDTETQMVHRYFDFDQDQWVFDTMDMIDDSLDVKTLIVNDDILKQSKQKPMIDQTWELDVAYTPIMMPAKEGHRQGVIRVTILADHQQQLIYDQRLITLQDDPNSIMMQMLTSAIIQRGIPQKLLVRDVIVQKMLSDLAKKLDMTIDISQVLDVIDVFVNEFSKQYAHKKGS